MDRLITVTITPSKGKPFTTIHKDRATAETYLKNYTDWYGDLVKAEIREWVEVKQEEKQ